MEGIISAFNFFSWKAPPIVPLIGKDLIQQGGIAILYGPYHQFKSMLINDMAWSLVWGKQWLGIYDTYPGAVWSIQLELSAAQWQKRMFKYAKAHGLVPLPTHELYLTTQHFLKLDTPAGVSFLVNGIKAHPNIKMIIVDPLTFCITGQISDSKDMILLVDNLKAVAFTYNITILLVMHTRKTQLNAKGDVLDLGAEDILGSTVLPACADTIIGIRPTMGECMSLVSMDKHRNSEQTSYPILKVKFLEETLGFKVT